MSKTSDTYAAVTQGVLRALETADPAAWRAPWHGISGLPRNLRSGRPYRGTNAWVLAAAQAEGAGGPTWATYRQWQGVGAQVRRGETSTPVLLWKKATKRADDDGTGAGAGEYLLVRTFRVFSSGQVDGWAEPTPGPALDVPAVADEWLRASGVPIVEAPGNRAFYSPADDRIVLPTRGQFATPEAFFGTAAHEVGHATGHESRLGRDLTGRFGTAAYAAEELVAELTAAYTLALVGLSTEPRPDHAQYVAGWLRLLSDDPGALVTAASRAQAASDWWQARIAASSATTAAA